MIWQSKARLPADVAQYRKIYLATEGNMNVAQYRKIYLATEGNMNVAVREVCVIIH